MTETVIVICAVTVTLAFLVFLWWIVKNKKSPVSEVDPQSIHALAEFVKIQKQQTETQQQLKELKRAGQKTSIK